MMPTLFRKSASWTSTKHAHSWAGSKQTLHYRTKCLASSTPIPSPLTGAVVGPRVRGKLDVKRARALDLKAGPLRARVAMEKTVTLVGEDGMKRVAEMCDIVGAKVLVRILGCVPCSCYVLTNWFGLTKLQVILIPDTTSSRFSICDWSRPTSLIPNIRGCLNESQKYIPP